MQHSLLLPSREEMLEAAKRLREQRRVIETIDPKAPEETPSRGLWKKIKPKQKN